MLEYNEVTPRKLIILGDEPYVVLTSVISKKSRQQASNQTKLRNLITGKVVSQAFHQRDKIEGAEIDNKEAMYLYNNKGQWWFCEKNNPSARFALSEETVGEQGIFLKENTPVTSLMFNEKIIGITLPPKVDLRVVEAPPSIRGDTATGGTKQVTLETGAIVNTPLFIDVGDIIRINTGNGNYSERIEKK